MKYEYLAAGNLIFDTLDFKDENKLTDPKNQRIGGPATYAYTGIRLFTDSVMQVSKTGKEYKTIMGDWMTKNNIEDKGFKVVCDRSNYSYGFMHAYGFSKPPKFNKYTLDAWQDFGYQKTSPEDIGEFTKDGGVKGVYIAANPDTTFWDQLGAIKKRDNFEIMWEIEGVWCEPEYLDMINYSMQYADIFSTNEAEMKALFNVETDEEVIKNLQKFDVDMTLYRVGARGLYVVTKNDAIYLPPAPGPVVGTLGCGNSSTGGALYGYCETHDPLKVGLYANVASSMNIRQIDVIPEFVESAKEAKELFASEYAKYSQKYGK